MVFYTMDNYTLVLSYDISKKKKNHFKWNVYSLDGYLYQIFFFFKKKNHFTSLGNWYKTS